MKEANVKTDKDNRHQAHAPPFRVDKVLPS